MTQVEMRILIYIAAQCDTTFLAPTEARIRKHVNEVNSHHALMALWDAKLIEKCAIRKPKSNYRYQLTMRGRDVLAGRSAA